MIFKIEIFKRHTDLSQINTVPYTNSINQIILLWFHDDGKYQTQYSPLLNEYTQFHSFWYLVHHL